MPNHVTTILEAPKEVIDFLKSDDREVDFETLVPTPDGVYQDGCDMKHPHPGYTDCWYDWNVNNWGTKWNAYEADRQEDTLIRFDTAWSHPTPIMEALSEKFPDVDLHVKYADEDTGYNLGEYWMTNGTITQEVDLVDGTPEALDFASWIKYGRSYAEIKAEWDAEEHDWAVRNGDPCECSACETAELESNETKQIEA